MDHLTIYVFKDISTVKSGKSREEPKRDGFNTVLQCILYQHWRVVQKVGVLHKVLCCTLLPESKTNSKGQCNCIFLSIHSFFLQSSIWQERRKKKKKNNLEKSQSPKLNLSFSLSTRKRKWWTSQVATHNPVASCESEKENGEQQLLNTRN